MICSDDGIVSGDACAQKYAADVKSLIEEREMKAILVDSTSSSLIDGLAFMYLNPLFQCGSISED